MIVYLYIRSWAGHDPDSTHSYGKLRGKSKDVELERELTAADAKWLRQKEDWVGWKLGMKTNKWNSEEELIEAALACYKDHFPEATALVVGDPCFIEPMPMVDGPPELMAEAAKLYEAYRSSNEEADLADEWQALVGDG